MPAPLQAAVCGAMCESMTSRPATLAGHASATALALRADGYRLRGAAMALAALTLAACLAAAGSASAADSQTRPAAKSDRYDPTLEVPPPRPLPMLKAPSPGNSEAGSPVRDYIYRPPADSGAITNRLVPPSTIRK